MQPESWHEITIADHDDKSDTMPEMTAVANHRAPEKIRQWPTYLGMAMVGVSLGTMLFISGYISGGDGKGKPSRSVVTVSATPGPRPTVTRTVRGPASVVTEHATVHARVTVTRTQPGVRTTVIHTVTADPTLGAGR